MIILAGPCQIESADHALRMAEALFEIACRLNTDIIFKASFDKANRTSATSPRGVGLQKAVEVFRKVKEQTGLKVITDVHESWQCEPIAEVVDILQIPAMLMRQTDLIEAAAKTGRHINIKQMQSLPREQMAHAVGKARRTGATTVWATERGASFGLHDLVVDMRSIPILKASGADAMIFDCTHSVQAPGSLGGSTGGARQYTPVLARAAIAAGADGLFLECHDDPDNALSDGPVMMRLEVVEDFLRRMIGLHEFVASP